GHPVEAKETAFAAACIRILTATCDGGLAPLNDLNDAVCKALNEKVQRISITSDVKREHYARLFEKLPPAHQLRARDLPARYVITSEFAVREAAEALIQYLNLTADCGPVHSMCKREGCGGLFMQKRGGQEYCSKACLAQQYSYQ